MEHDQYRVCPASAPAPPPERADSISISCEACELEGTAACEDCLVSFILSRDPEDAVVFDVAEARALRLLSRAGLVPGLRHSTAPAAWDAS